MTTVEHTDSTAEGGARTAEVLAEARAWLEANWSPDLTLGEWWDRIGRSGWAFPAWPERWFGKGLPSAVAREVVADRLRMGIFGPVSGIATFLAAPTILACGSDEQKDRFMPGIVTGRDVWCQLFSEPGAGSDMASLQTRAVRDGDEWVVTGQKVWNSGASTPRYGILIARTDPDVPKHKGISYFLIDMEQPGVDVRPLREMTGEAAFNEVFLTEARVPDANLLGGPGEGWRVAMTTLANERDPGNPGMGPGGGSLMGRPDLTLTVAEYQRQQARDMERSPSRSAAGSARSRPPGRAVRAPGRSGHPPAPRRASPLTADAALDALRAKASPVAPGQGPRPKLAQPDMAGPGTPASDRAPRPCCGARAARRRPAALPCSCRPRPSTAEPTRCSATSSANGPSVSPRSPTTHATAPSASSASAPNADPPQPRTAPTGRPLRQRDRPVVRRARGEPTTCGAAGPFPSRDVLPLRSMARGGSE